MSDAAALAADIRDLVSASGAATEADLASLGWSADDLQRLMPAARAALGPVRTPKPAAEANLEVRASWPAHAGRLGAVIERTATRLERMAEGRLSRAQVRDLIQWMRAEKQRHRDDRAAAEQAMLAREVGHA